MKTPKTATDNRDIFETLPTVFILTKRTHELLEAGIAEREIHLILVRARLRGFIAWVVTRAIRGEVQTEVRVINPADYL